MTPMTVDSRTVRSVMEQDALAQALQLQAQVQSLVSAVQEVRVHVSETAALARTVSSAIQTNVVLEEDAPRGIVGMARDPTTANQGETLPDAAAPVTTTTTAAAIVQEQQLASRLHEAFVQRDLARQRVEAVHAFFDRFDLSPQEARLLEQYAFEDLYVPTMSSEERPVLSSTMPPNGIAFLKALERLRRVRRALSDTFGSPRDMSLAAASHEYASNSKAGLAPSSALRMMERLAQTQERAYERLYHWLQSYLQLSHASVPTSSNAVQQQHQLSSAAADNLEEALQHPFVQRALQTLRHVPAFYTHTLELIASSRRTEQTRRFLLALTTGANGLAPLELKSQSHDPVGYTADLLAWVFSAFSVEADVARGMIDVAGDESTEEKDASEHEENHDGDDSEAVHVGSDDDGLMLNGIDKPLTADDILAMSMGGLARPLKSRILQVITRLARRPDQDSNDYDDDNDGYDDFEEEGKVQRNRITHLYELCGLLLFYTSAMNKTILKLREKKSPLSNTGVGDLSDCQQPVENPLVDILLQCFTEAAKAYEATIRVYAAVMSSLSSATGESESVLTHLLLSKIAEVRRNSPGFATNVECPADYADILSIDWVTGILVQAAIATCKNLDDAVALQQSVAASKQAGMSIVAAEKLDEDIEQMQAVLVNQLVELEASKVLDICGLGQIISNWRLWQEVKDEGTQMVAYPGLSQPDVEAGMKEFYASLYAPPLPSLETTVKDPVLRKSARSKITESVCATYEAIYEAILSPTYGGYDDTSFLGHTPDQVRTLIMH